MLRIFVLAAAIVDLAGCETMAEAARQQEAARQAQQDVLPARIAELPSEKKANAQRCSSIAEGKITALRNANQGASTHGVTDYTIVDNCLTNPHCYESIPTVQAQVIVNAASCAPTPALAPEGPRDLQYRGQWGRDANRHLQLTPVHWKPVGADDRIV